MPSAASGRTVLPSWPIEPAIVVEVMLTVMFFSVDMAALRVLGVMQAATLLRSDRAVRCGTTFHTLDARMAALEAVGFAPSQGAGLPPLVDATGLLLLALIDTWHGGSGGGLGVGLHAECGQYGGEERDTTVHDGSFFRI